jgi:hypothetical protein
VSEHPENEKQNRNQLMIQRNVLFERFLNNPMEIRLSLEIRAIDDQVAECNERIRVETKTRNSK